MDLMQLYHITLWTVFLTGIGVLAILFFIPAPYGRFSRPGWGLRLDARTAWIIMELPAFGIILASFLLNLDKIGPVEIVLLLLWEAHYVYRTFVYPALLRGSTRSFPILLILFAWVFNSANGFINGHWLFSIHAPFALSWFADPRFILGAVMFLSGMTINIWSDRILTRLRKDNTRSYGIPQEGFFRLVSSPNYFGEILEWCGWALMTWSLAGLLFAFFTFCNLAPRAWANFKWYRKTFPSYPVKRKALIPFIW